VETDTSVVELTPKQTRDRIFALLSVFAVVIFFWMAFHQNGLTLTWFAKNYTVGQVGNFTNIFFDLPAFLSLIGIIVGLVFLIMKRFKGAMKGAGAALIVVGALILYWRLNGFSDFNPISPELFQAFNPIFVVFLTPIVIGFFAMMARKDKEPSSPKKIGIGMMLLALGWVVMIIAGRGLASPASLKSVGGVSPMLVSSYWLMSVYITMTVAELFISPMGLAYVAKVSPPKFRGMMQGGWLAATAVGNSLSGLVAIPYAKLELWQTFGLLVLTSVIAGGIMFGMMRKLERAVES
jgi:POT family proton-dependent oligopeptide transporter